jgi:long-chain acyl-CoA synthetase
MILGDGRPFLSALLVLNPEQWEGIASELQLDSRDPGALRSAALEKLVFDKLARQLAEFPGYARIHGVTCTLEPWTIDNELITPTLKLKRNRIMERFAADIDRMYEGHR